MKYTFLIISVLLAVGLCAQVDTARELPKRNAKFADKVLQADSAMIFPQDTFKMKSTWRVIQFKGTSPYYWNGVKWSAFTGGSGWGFSGDAISSGQFIGTTNAQDFVIKTGTGLDEVMRFSGDGLYKITMGYNNTASGSQGIAIGGNNTASGNSSLVFGNSSTASGLQSISLGSQNTASGTASTTIGAENIASGNYSFATGYKDTASALYSAVFGGESKASGNYSFAQGHESIASGVASIAMGNGAVSTGYGATTFGKGFTNAKDTSFAVGFTTRKLEVSPDSVIISPAVGVNVTANKVDMFNSVGKRQFTLDPNNGYWALGDWAGDYGNATSIHIADSTGEVRIDGYLNVQQLINESATDLSYPLWYNDLSQDFTAGTGVDSIWRASDSIRFRVRSAIVGKAGTFGIYAPTSGGGGGVTTLAAIGSTPNANGATISGSTLNLEPASASFGGVVTTGTQTFAGAKTFSSNAVINGMTAGTYGGDQGFQVTNSKSLYFVTNGSLLNFEAGSAKLQVQIAGAGAYTQGSLVYGGNTGYWRMGSNMQILGSAGYTSLGAAGTADHLVVASGGNVGVGTTSPSTYLDINGNKFRVRTAKTPSSATDTGSQGDICWDADYIYICTATNTWKRVAVSTW